MLPSRFSEIPYVSLRREVDRLFDDFLGAPGFLAPTPSRRRDSGPALNVWENDENLYVEAECPGCRLEQLELSLTGSHLTIAGKREGETVENGRVHRRERTRSTLARTVNLPFEVDTDKVEASLRDGILLIKLPKAESAKPKKIAVRT